MDKRLRLQLIAVSIGPFFSLMSIGLINIALPQLIFVFDENMSVVQWITLGYLIALPSFIPIMGKIGDRYGQRNVHNMGFLIFGIASVLIVITPHFQTIILFRILQGLGAAMFQATNISLISLNFPNEYKGRAMGFLGTSVAIGTMAGPIVGGILIQWLPWQSLFLVNVPFSVIGLYLAIKYIPKTKTSNFEKVDYLGAFLFTVFMSSLMFIISMGNQWGWLEVKSISFIVIVIFSFILFTWRNLKSEYPFINYSFFQNKVVLMGILVSTLSFMTTFSVLVVMPFQLQSLLNINPLFTGVIMMAYPVVLAIASPIFGSMSDRYDTHNSIVNGIFIISFSIFIANFWIGESFFIPVIVMSFMGLGMGMVTSPNYSLVISHAPQNLVGMTGGFIALGRTVGMALGATLGFVLINIWIPNGAGDITTFLGNENKDLYQFVIMGFSTVYITMASLLLIFAIIMKVLKT